MNDQHRSSTAHRSRIPRAVRRRDGHDAVREGRVHQPVLRRAERARARSRARRAPRLREGGRRGARDEQLRREPAQARAVRTRGADARAQQARRRARARGGGRRTRRARRRRGRATRCAARALRPDVGRGGAGDLPRADGRAEGGRRRPLHPRDVQRPARDRAGDHRGARGRSRHAGRRTDDHRRRWTHAVRRDAGRRRARARPLRRRRHRPQLLRRSADDSRGRREDGAGDAEEDLRAAERRHAARRGRTQHVHGERRVHGGVRAASRAGGREGRGRLLRHDAGAHQRDVRRHSSAQPALRAHGCDVADRRGQHAAGAGEAAHARRAAHPARRALALGREDRRRTRSSRRWRSCRRAAWMRRACSPTSACSRRRASMR